MTYNFFGVIDATDDDEAIYPVLSAPDAPYPVATNQADGRVTHLTATKVRVLGTDVKGGLSDVTKLQDDLKWELLVTDARLIVYCVKFDKGGGWSGFGLGGLAVAAAANAVSKARAANRRKGKLLVAQVRYPWVERILAAPKQGWGSSETLRIRVDSQPGGEGHRHLILELHLPKQLDALSVGHDLAVRTARYRLANGVTMGSEERLGFEHLASTARRIPEPPSEPKQTPWAVYVMPTSYRVNEATAFPRPLVGESEA